MKEQQEPAEEKKIKIMKEVIFHIDYFLIFSFIDIYLLYSFVLISAVKWFSYTVQYIHSFLMFFSIMVYHSILNIVPYAIRRTLLLTQYIYNSFHQLISNKKSIPQRNQNHPKEKEMQEGKVVVWVGFTNTWGKKNSERHQKGKRHEYPNVHRSTVYNSQDMEAT